MRSETGISEETGHGLRVTGGAGGHQDGRAKGQFRADSPVTALGNAQRNYERYIALAREAALAGDTVEMENCYQHAEHYFRVMRERST
jgi:hypothetical protein